MSLLPLGFMKVQQKTPKVPELQCVSKSTDKTLSTTTKSSADDILKLPQIKSSAKQISSLTSSAQLLTDSPFLSKLNKRKVVKEKKSKATKSKKSGTSKVYASTGKTRRPEQEAGSIKRY